MPKLFPLRDYKYNLPKSDEPGSFGFIRKFDIHTGVDLYCNHYDNVYAIEDGIVVNKLPFTGIRADSPWWNDTEALMIEGESGVILYGEIIASKKDGDLIKQGDFLGTVIPVLKKDKGVVPSTSMLHIELYESNTIEPVVWELNKTKPYNLLDVGNLLHNICNNEKIT